jgi:hypothetical protein
MVHKRKKKKELTVKQAMEDWKKLTPDEKEKIYESWEMSAGERWDKEFSQLKVDELFEVLGGMEIPRKLLRLRKR